MKKLNQFLSFTVFVFLLTSLLFTGCGEREREITKPTIMILGSRHLANPGIDAVNYKMDDVLAPKRQGEIEQLVQQLKKYSPTKIALEQDPSRNAEINTNYQGYLAGTYKLQRWEIDQIGFRLAKQMEHSEVYCVDYFPDQDPFFSEDFDSNLTDIIKFAKEHNQEHLLPSVEDNTDSNADFHEEEDGRVWIVPTKYESLIDLYIRDNKPEGRRAEHQLYLQMARVGLKDQYLGANWVGHIWYTRNLKIFVNLTRITESADDRILLIIGAGHVYLVQHFLEASGKYIVESPLKYLKSENAN
ncbi:MAG: DUF5694 domain-containing protein [Candidatus Poribacteria bacterium]|nr:DUF5694 domain-containing protein [Candidatus Poribacteria bacterium]